MDAGDNPNTSPELFPVRFRPLSGKPIAVLRIVSELGTESEFVITSSAQRVTVGKSGFNSIIVSDPRLAYHEFEILLMKEEPATGAGNVRFLAKEPVKRRATLVNGAPIRINGRYLEDGDVLEITGLSFHFKTMPDDAQLGFAAADQSCHGPCLRTDRAKLARS
jgi:hypothetical protein